VGGVTSTVATGAGVTVTADAPEIVPNVAVMFSGEPESQDDPDVYPLAPTANAIDLGQAVREELALAVEGFPLCREDCKGLCPKCGADLNAGPCEHTQPSHNT